MTPKGKEMLNYAAIVEPEEMQDARQWLASMLQALTAVEKTSDVRPEIICVSQGWSELQIGRSVAKIPLYLAGRKYASGLGTHADSEILVRLPVGTRRLTGRCGINDSWETRRFAKLLVFSVEVDGKEVWRSGPQDVAAAPARVDAALAGRKQFTLKVKGPLKQFAHADWVDLKVTLANGKSVDIGRPTPVNPGFSFQYGGDPSAELLPTWRLKKQRLPEKDGVILHRITRTDPKTGLAVICEIKEYTRFPVLEWGLRLKNTSKRKTPEIAHIRSLDVAPWLGRVPYLNYWTGNLANLPEGYEPFRVPLANGEEYRFAPAGGRLTASLDGHAPDTFTAEGGRPTDSVWPCYHLESAATNRGLVVAIGAISPWATCFRGLDNEAVHIAAGQERAPFKLVPAEETQTAVSVLMYYHGDRVRSQNLWRRWVRAHHLPPAGGRIPEWLAPLLTPMLLACRDVAAAETMQATPVPKIVLGEPVVVSRPPADMVLLNEWAGPWQFPGIIQRLPDGRLQIAYHLYADSVAEYGKPPGVAVSADDGKTWADMKAGDPGFSSVPGFQVSGLLALPNGDLLRQVPLGARKIEDIREKLPPPFTTWTCGGVMKDTIYLAEQMPRELAGYRFSRLKKGAREWVEETAAVIIPGEIRECFLDDVRADGNYLVLPWILRIKIAPDGTLWGLCPLIRVIDGTLRKPYRVSFLRSTDHGHTWNLLSEIPYQPDKEADRFWDKSEGFVEPDIAFLPDGSVFCLMRTGGPSYASRSTDNGKTWSTPAVFDNLGVYPALVTLRNGVTLASYGRPGLFLRATSDPSGRAWGSSATVVHPGALGSDTCSYSSLIALDDHTALIAYADFNYPDEEGKPRKAILVRKITVTAK